MQIALPYLIALVLLLMLLVVGYSQHSNVVTEHNVVIYSQLSNGDWIMSSDEEHDLVFRPCLEDIAMGVDVNGMLRQAVGPPHYVAERASWQERGTCKSILRADLGFWFRDKANGFQYRRVN